LTDLLPNPQLGETLFYHIEDLFSLNAQPIDSPPKEATRSPRRREKEESRDRAAKLESKDSLGAKKNRKRSSTSGLFSDRRTREKLRESSKEVKEKGKEEPIPEVVDLGLEADSRGDEELVGGEALSPRKLHREEAKRERSNPTPLAVKVGT
jgi:hypothetical protein